MSASTFAEKLPAVGGDRTGPKVLVVGGGPGGTGKTLMASSLAVCLAQLGRRVALLDADVCGSGIANVFGIDRLAAHQAVEAESSEDDDVNSDGPFALTESAVSGLALGLLAAERTRSPLSHRTRASRYLAQIARLPFEYVVVDAGAGESAFTIDLMLAADAPIVVCVPEPRAIECLSRFLRAAHVRRVQRIVGRDPLGRPMVARALASVGPLPSRHALCDALALIDRSVAERARALTWSPFVVTNQARVRGDMELGSALRVLLGRHYGLGVRDVGHVEYDEAVVQSARRRVPLLLDNPTAKGARNVEKVVRRILATGTPRDASDEPVYDDSHYALLAVERSSSDEEIRRATKRQRELYGVESIAAVSLLSHAALVEERARVDRAAATLLDAAKRAAYDRERFPSAEGEATPRAAGAIRADENIVRAVLEEAGPGAVVTGALLKKVRIACGIELAEISARTKVSRTHLEALEEEDFARLPASVYVRGFVIEFAKALRLDPTHAERSYMERLRQRTA